MLEELEVELTQALQKHLEAFRTEALLLCRSRLQQLHPEPQQESWNTHSEPPATSTPVTPQKSGLQALIRHRVETTYREEDVWRFSSRQTTRDKNATATPSQREARQSALPASIMKAACHCVAHRWDRQQLRDELERIARGWQIHTVSFRGECWQLTDKAHSDAFLIGRQSSPQHWLIPAGRKLFPFQNLFKLKDPPPPYAVIEELLSLPCGRLEGMVFIPHSKGDVRWR